MVDYARGMSLRGLFVILIFGGITVLVSGLDASVELTVDGDGFHRHLIYRTDVADFEQPECHVALHLELPAALYVNVDELADLRRSGDTVACSIGETNVELFTEKAKPQNVTVCSRLINGSATMRFLIHQRYQYAKKNGGYNTVILPKPKLLLGCPERIKEYRVSKLNLCSPCVHSSPKWREIPYKMDQEDSVWLVPVGDESLLTFISYVTLFVTIIGAAFITRTILKAMPNEQDKQD